MSQQTSSHGWTIPTVGADDGQWGQILNDFIDNELERQVILEGTFPNRPAAGSSVVKFFLATDRNIVYYNDGSSWRAIYGIGADGNPVPAKSYFQSMYLGTGSNPANQTVRTSRCDLKSNGVDALTIWEDGANSYGNITWYSSDVERVAKVTGDATENAFSVYVRDSGLDGTQGGWAKAIDAAGGLAADRHIRFPNHQLAIPNDGIVVGGYANNNPGVTMDNGPIDFNHDSGFISSSGSGSGVVGVEDDFNGGFFWQAKEADNSIHFYKTTLLRGDVEDDSFNTVYDQSASQVPYERVEGGERVAANGLVTLSSGSATVSTGITTTGTHIDVRLDPSGNGNNAADVKARYRTFWDNAAGEYKVDILEDGTSVGSPDIGYEILAS